jgi:DNA-binding MurR/RpiR family transcriptional regulator
MENANVPYLSPTEVATKLGVSVNTVGRAARKAGCGVYTHGGVKLAAVHPTEVASLKTHIHETSGNPVWIAAFKKKRK